MDQSVFQLLDDSLWSGKIYLGGWVPGAGGGIEIIAPADGAHVATIGRANADDAARAAARASAAQPAWQETPALERARILNKAADILVINGEEAIPWIIRETGSTRAKAQVEIHGSADFLRTAAAAAMENVGCLIPSADGRHEELLRVPHGVIGSISPFNFPLILSIRVIAAALATGNAVVHKPDPRTPITGGIIIARIFQAAGLPQDLLHILPGGADVGAALCEDRNIAMVSFTGSPEAGAKVGEACGRNLKRVQLELGGKNALIVLDDADLAAAASNAAWGAWLHQGQICMATGLILAPAAMVETLAQELAARADRLPVGDPAKEDCALGPLIDGREVARIEGIIADAVGKGAQLLAGGIPTDTMFPATVLSGVKPGMRAFEEEIFGPVAVVVSYDDDDHAVELANASEFGLAAGIIGKDLGRARALGNRLKVGHLHINDQTVTASPHAPFGGRGRSGNGTRISGPAIWEEFTQWVWVTTLPQPRIYPF